MSIVRHLTAAIGLVLLAGPVLSADQSPVPEYPLEILNILPVGTDGMQATNRIFRAYPGIPYNIRAAVIGGRYPYTFRLTQAPEGMTIDPQRGEIDWPDPRRDAAAEIEVTDSAGNTLTAAWNIHVTTENFLFVDAENGRSAADGGKGTLQEPFRTIADFYPDDERTGLRTSRYTDWAVYFRAGTYKLDGFKSGWGGLNDKEWMNFRDQHPNILMAYPGEVVTFDLEGRHSITVYGQSGFYMDGIRFRGSRDYGYAIQLTPEGKDLQLTTLRRLDMQGLSRRSTSTGTHNESFIRLRHGGHVTERLVIQDSVFDDLDFGSGIKLYTCDKVLIEDNAFSNFRDTFTGGANLDGAVAFKVCVNRTVFRDNVIRDFDGGRAISCLLSTPYRGRTFRGTADNEIHHNLVYNITGGMAVSVNGFRNPGPIHIYNNTIIGNVSVTNVGPEAGPVTFYRNIIVPTGGEAVRHGRNTEAERVFEQDNLVLGAADLDEQFRPVGDAAEKAGAYGR